MNQQKELLVALNALEEILEQQIVYHAKSYGRICAIREKLALVCGWIIRARMSTCTFALAVELKSGIGKAIDMHITGSPLNDETELRIDDIYNICCKIVKKGNKDFELEEKSFDRDCQKTY